MIFFLILIICAILQFFLPWWIIMLVPFLIAIWKGEKAGRTFLAGFAAVFITWLCYSLYIHFSTGGILTGKVAEMLVVKSPMVLILVTSIVGGLAAGISALTGYFCKEALKPKSK